ncbi:MAG: hypothetical protein ABIF77_01585 [bacterium]
MHGRQVRIIRSIVLLAVAVFYGGCEQDYGQAIHQDTGLSAAEATDQLQAEVVLCRRVSRSGKPLNPGREFSMTESGYVGAFVKFQGLETGRTYSIHLVWLKPDGAEIFRKYAEVELTEIDTGYVTDIQWRKAEDFSYLRQKSQESETPEFYLDTRLNISAGKNREPGIYFFRVYVDRELFRETTFELKPE